MSLKVNIPVNTFELLYGPIIGKSEEQIISLIFEGIEAAFSNAMGIAIAESNNCKLKYLDISNHPFKDLGGWRELANISPEETSEIKSGTKCLSFSLPISEDFVQILKECA